MKRPPGLWLLLSAGVLWLSLQNVYALRATELIFGKTSTTTTTEAVSAEGEALKDGASTEATEQLENATTVKTTNLTGNPQIDYLFDPNLPRELNGYNLSSYPFYNSMPEDITFKCDGLHDGFYASVPHKCQVYHHCLFGTRYDFLCANYTAFDQKTFICHFVSEVDCNNSHKYWHRNDALYQAATTTTIKPPPVVISPALTATARRPSPLRPRRPSRRRPQYDYYDEEYEDEAAREDYYEEPPPRRRRKRPRPRPRPVYDDDYEDYEEDRYERRGSGRRNNPGEGRRRDYDDDRKQQDRREHDDRRRDEDNRKPYDDDSKPKSTDEDRKPLADRDTERKSQDRDYDDRRSVNNDKKPQDRDYDRRQPEDDHGNDRKTQDDRREPEERRTGSDNRKPSDRREPEERDRKPYDRRPDYDDRRHDDRKRFKEDRRRDYNDRPRHDKDDEDYRYDRDRRKDDDRKRRPAYDDDLDDRDDRRSVQDKRSSNDRRYEKRRPALDEGRSHDRSRKGQRRPYDDYEDEKDDRRSYDRPRKNENRDDSQSQDSSKHQSDVPLVKPNSGSSVYSQPRMPPRIRPPVPKNEQTKFAYKPTTEKSTTKKPSADEDVEYYEDYEDEVPSKHPPPTRANRKPEPEPTDTRRPHKTSNVENDEKRDNRRPLGSASRPRIQMTRRPPVSPVDEEYEEEKPRPRHHTTTRPPRYNNENKEKPISTRNRSNFEEVHPENDGEKTTKAPTISRERTQTQTNSKFLSKEQRYKLRQESTTATTTTSTTTTTTTTIAPTTTAAVKELPRERPEPIVRVVKRPFLPSRGGNPYSSRGLQPVGAKALEGFKRPVTVPPEVPSTSSELPTEAPVDQSKVMLEEEEGEEDEEPRPDVTPLKIEDDPPPPQYENTEQVQNGRQYPTEPKVTSFLINEESVDNYKRKPTLPEEPTRDTYEEDYKTEPKEPQEKLEFKPSPVLMKVPARPKYSNPVGNEDDENEFRPVSNRPIRPNNRPKLYQEPRTTEKPNVPERNPLDINENEYDVTLNDALNPTIPNLPVRNFPAGFNTANDYTFSSFHRPRYDVSLNQATENRYQLRAPSQRVETVVQPYIHNGDGKKYVNTNPPQYTSLPSDQVYQTQNFRSNPQITQAQTQAFYSVY